MASPRYAAHRVLLSWNDDELTEFTLVTVRRLTLVAFGGFLASRLLQWTLPGTVFDGLLGNLLALFSGLAMLSALSSRAQRLFTEDSGKLDEYQRSRRNAALHGAYGILSAILIASGLYVMLALDWSWPLPTSPDVLSDLAFGALLMACLLPVTILSWSLDLSEDPAAPEQEA